ncbi:hypothetical protein SODALDRAFT_173793 [Sodiomyces alkalinus F11]|uniref:Uncharacterized protein n=1 Tax=Sodiomyces alkalinus (strain CBS 110278 / VKM F-3762 / F11) TaxID=1314773 RepID=A0A3N2PTF0_SODAK|nr:hypothetical protein SODALDRAFT_173793 [Sodiomyces alkalinus F11]ROT37761.1 hypothetical protein SODALDRAFT_173793 [Sodiomyces alkalinus F11]
MSFPDVTSSQVAFKEAVAALIQAIHNHPDYQEPLLYVDLEGVNLSRREHLHSDHLRLTKTSRIPRGRTHAAISGLHRRGTKRVNAPIHLRVAIDHQSLLRHPVRLGRAIHTLRDPARRGGKRAAYGARGPPRLREIYMAQVEESWRDLVANQTTLRVLRLRCRAWRKWIGISVLWNGSLVGNLYRLTLNSRRMSDRFSGRIWVPGLLD